MQSNPVVVDGVLYATTPALKVIALDAATGHERWRFDPAAGSAAGARFRHRGVTVHNDRVFVTCRNFLWALDRKSGAPISSFGTGGRDPPESRRFAALCHSRYVQNYGSRRFPDRTRAIC